MKVILLKRIPHVGNAGDVRDVSDGYSRNFLLPQHLAKIATATVIKEAEGIRRRVLVEEEKEMVNRKAAWESIQRETLTFRRRANAEGQLFGSVDTAHIVEALQQRGYTGVREDHVRLESPLKVVGEHTVPLHFGEGLGGVIQIKIDREE